jgi:hypothetical protein
MRKISSVLRWCWMVLCVMYVQVDICGVVEYRYQIIITDMEIEKVQLLQTFSRRHSKTPLNTYDEFTKNRQSRNSQCVEDPNYSSLAWIVFYYR